VSSWVLVVIPRAEGQALRHQQVRIHPASGRFSVFLSILSLHTHILYFDDLLAAMVWCCGGRGRVASVFAVRAIPLTPLWRRLTRMRFTLHRPVAAGAMKFVSLGGILLA